jgi:hypothetical protein
MQLEAAGQARTTPPVVFLIFNRPRHTAEVFAQIRQARPEKLLVVADGPRSGRSEDAAQCAATRAIVDAVDWPCVVLKNFSEHNLGCRPRVASGLDWAFSQVEQAIVLEDDCVPHPSFFPYCAELLDRYAEDERIMSISGDNYQRGHWRGPGSYYFSKYGTCWGWASWRRAWKRFDLSMSLWPEFRDVGALRDICPDPTECDYWSNIFEAMHAGKVDSWAYAWVFAHFCHNGLSPHPNRNLIRNIGCGPEGTHTISDSVDANLPTFEIGPISHPAFMVPHRIADMTEFDTSHGGAEMRKARTLSGKIRSFSNRVRSRSMMTVGALLRKSRRLLSFRYP